MFDKFTLRNRIFLFSSLLVLLAFTLMWLFVRPQYREAIVNERTTIVSQLQEYSLKRSDQIVRNWLNSVNYMAEEIASDPVETQNIVTKTVNLTPGLMRILISQEGSTESFDLRHSIYDDVNFETIQHDWYASRLDPKISVSWAADTTQSRHFLTALRLIQIGKEVYRIFFFFDANSITNDLTNIPLGGNYVANIVASDGKNIVPTTSFEFPSELIGDASYSNQSTYELGNKNWFVMTSRFETTPFWHVIAVEDSFILEPVRNLVIYSGITATMILITLFVFSWYVSFRVNKPVDQIIADVEHMSTLNFEHRIKPVELPEFDLVQETLESIRLTLLRYQKINVEKIILEEWKNRYMMTYSEDLIAILNGDGTFSFLNNNFQRFLESQSIDPKEDTFEHVLKHKSIKVGKYEQTTHYPDPFTVNINRAEIEHVLNQDKSYFYDFQNLSIVDKDGIEQAALVIMHDMTEDRLNDIKRNDMINIIVHELKNPITGVIGLSQVMLENQNIDAEEQNVLLNEINLSGERMNTLVNRFLEIQKLESGSVTIDMENVDIMNITKNVRSITNPLLSNKHLTTKIETTGKNFKVWGSKDLIFDAIQNLLSNAIKYGDTNREIYIKLEEESESVKVSITDHGYGISLEDQKKVFEKFFRVKSNSKSLKEKGTGLGLAYVREILHRHNGEIELESNEKIGSRFTLIFPKKRAEN
ncbi:MAG: HAMP domain-containing sensor histidine kinase [Gracilimonas sp.]